MAEGQGARLSDDALHVIRNLVKAGLADSHYAGLLLADHDALAAENARFVAALERIDLATYSSGTLLARGISGVAREALTRRADGGEEP